MSVAANQTLGAMIRKLNDQEYKNLKDYIPAFQFAMNITPHSAIGCSPFEVGHGLPASTLSNARILASRYPRNHLEGHDGDSIEDVEPKALQGKVKDLIELAMRMSEVAKSSSEWAASAHDGTEFRSKWEENSNRKLHTWY